MMAVKGISTRAAQAERTRQQILETAQRLFTELGYDATSLQMIADEMTSRRGVTSGKMHLIAALIPQLHPFIGGAKQPQGAVS